MSSAVASSVVEEQYTCTGCESVVFGEEMAENKCGDCGCCLCCDCVFIYDEDDDGYPFLSCFECMMKREERKNAKGE
jgi:hypothetical protein